MCKAIKLLKDGSEQPIEKTLCVFQFKDTYLKNDKDYFLLGYLYFDADKKEDRVKEYGSTETYPLSWFLNYSYVYNTEGGYLFINKK